VQGLVGRPSCANDVRVARFMSGNAPARGSSLTLWVAGRRWTSSRRTRRWWRSPRLARHAEQGRHRSTSTLVDAWSCGRSMKARYCFSALGCTRSALSLVAWSVDMYKPN
jgi:hypothetical protein